MAGGGAIGVGGRDGAAGAVVAGGLAGGAVGEQALGGALAGGAAQAEGGSPGARYEGALPGALAGGAAAAGGLAGGAVSAGGLAAGGLAAGRGRAREAGSAGRARGGRAHGGCGGRGRGVRRSRFSDLLPRRRIRASRRSGCFAARGEGDPAFRLVGATAAGQLLALFGLAQADPAAAAQDEPQHDRQDDEHRDDHDDDPQGLRHPSTLSRRAPCGARSTPATMIAAKPTFAVIEPRERPFRRTAGVSSRGAGVG